MELRDYQKECVGILDAMERGSVLVVMATGLGKTVVFSSLKRRGRVLILSHREELVRQPIGYFNCPCGIEQGANVSHGEEVVSASVMSLAKRLDRFSPYEFDTIITDEAHHAAAPTYKKIYSHFKPRLHVGFTATPNRGDKVRLDDVFDAIIFERNLKWGIENGWLSDAYCLRVNASFDLRSVKRRGGDFVASDLDRAVNVSRANAEVGEVYRRYAKGQTLIFAASVDHAKNIAACIPGAAVVSADTPDRASIISDFTSRKIPCIVNCMVFTEGTDMPMIETVIIARPTQNPSLYAQMVGRGLRKAAGKDHLTVIDLVGVTDKLEICTAPTLMGLDVGDIPPYRQKLIEGRLSEMQALCERAADCPERWMLNVQAVRLFAKEQGVDIRRINWTKKSNGDLVYQFTSGDRVGIKAINDLGKTRIMYYLFDENKDGFVYSESEEMGLQQALDAAYAFFFAHYRDEEKLWNLAEYLTWENAPATEKQVSFIRSRLSEEEFSHLKFPLTKGEAAQILNALRLRNLSVKDLLAMRRRKIAEKKAEEEERQRLAAIKIRYIIDKKKKFCKYYAVKMPDDLVITNEWETAEELIAKYGDNVRYKGFYSKEAAVDYLRGKK